MVHQTPRPALARIAALALVALALLAPLGVGAAPAKYDLDQKKSVVSFTYIFNGDKVKGTMPITGANLILDFDRAANSRIDVTMAADKARAGFPFATNAIRSENMLNARAFPRITFKSTRVQRKGSNATVEGDVTIRGVTLPLTLQGRIYRQRGSAEGDVSELQVLLTGQIDRRDFGATGFPNMIEDQVALRILTEMTIAE